MRRRASRARRRSASTSPRSSVPPARAHDRLGPDGRPAHAVTRTRFRASRSARPRCAGGARRARPRIDERTAPLARPPRARGVPVRPCPGSRIDRALDGAGVNHWRPVAPLPVTSSALLDARLLVPGHGIPRHQRRRRAARGSRGRELQTSDVQSASRITYDVHARSAGSSMASSSTSGARPFAKPRRTALRRTAFGLRRPLRVTDPRDATAPPARSRTAPSTRSAVRIAQPHQSTLIGRARDDVASGIRLTSRPRALPHPVSRARREA